MADDNLDQLAANARRELRVSLEARPPDVGRLAQRALARRRALVRVAAAIVVLAVAVPLALHRDGDDAQIIAGPSENGSTADPLRETVVEFVDLRGRVSAVVLPISLAGGFEIVEQDAGLTVDGTSWRVDATRTIEPAAAETEKCAPAPDAVIGRVGMWTLTFTGNEMTPGNCELLRSQIASFGQQPNGFLMYSGPGTIGPIDGPDALAETATGRIYLFHRSCSEPTETLTLSGLTVARIDDPARGATLTVLCSTVNDLELWIEAPQWPSQEQLDVVAIR